MKMLVGMMNTSCIIRNHAIVKIGDIGKKKKEEANKKRKDFYKTEEGLAKKKHYAEKAAKKHEMIKMLNTFLKLEKCLHCQL